MSTDATFGVYWDPYEGARVEEKRGVDAVKALDAFGRLTGPACVAVVQRVWIVCEQDDVITLDWRAQTGIVFPRPQDAQYESFSRLYPARPRPGGRS